MVEEIKEKKWNIKQTNSFIVHNIHAHVLPCNERNISVCCKFTQLHSHQILLTSVNIWLSYCEKQMGELFFETQCSIIHIGTKHNAIEILIWKPTTNTPNIYWRDLEVWVRGRSRSLEMASFDISHTSSYLSSVVTMVVSCIVFKIKQYIIQKTVIFLYRLPFNLRDNLDPTLNFS